jgi:dipeptidyl aminopeptidase/acylaminoacyl peptidase
MGMPGSIELRWLTGQNVSLARPMPANILTETLRWSPDGKELAFFAYGDAPINPLLLYGSSAAEVMMGPGTRSTMFHPHSPPPDVARRQIGTLENPARLWRVKVDQGLVEQIGTGEIDLGYLGAPSFTWTASGELVFHAPLHSRDHTLTLNNVPRRGNYQPAPLGPRPKLEWVVLGRDGRTRPLAGGDDRQLPASLFSIEGGAGLVGIEAGELWRIDPVNGTVRNLTTQLSPDARDVLWISPSNRRTSIVLSTAAGANGGTRPAGTSESDYYVVDGSSGALTHLSKPVPESTPIAFSSETESTIYYDDSNNGTFLWSAAGTRPSTSLVLTANAFRSRIIKAETRMVDFTSLNGDQLKAALSLPIRYEPGRRYPLIVVVYLGDYEKQLARQLNPRAAPGDYPWQDIACAAGYAHLMPSIPINIPGMDKEEGESILMLSNAILPAVQKAIDMGVADPDRLFVMGWSKGGWSTAGVLTQSIRFKAAMAGAGVYNEGQKFSAGGSLWRNIYSRYTDTPHEAAMPTAYYTGMYPTDVPWWRDGDRIRRNSPFSYVDRIQTPLLIVHGDLDPLPLDQAEDLFNALVAQRKRAQFVRYWGEAHELKTPANLRDLWQRIFAWFDEFGDIARDGNGEMVFDGDRVRSRNGAAALTPADFARFGPAAPVRDNSDASH